MCTGERFSDHASPRGTVSLGGMQNSRVCPPADVATTFAANASSASHTTQRHSYQLIHARENHHNEGSRSCVGRYWRGFGRPAVVPALLRSFGGSRAQQAIWLSKERERQPGAHEDVGLWAQPRGNGIPTSKSVHPICVWCSWCVGEEHEGREQGADAVVFSTETSTMDDDTTGVIDFLSS